MKKFLALSILLMSAIIFVPSAEAKSSSYNSTANGNATAPQVIYRQNQRRYNRNNRAVRVVTSVRNVRVGRRIYRETIQTKYQPNGRVTTRLIKRVLVGRY